MKNDYNICHFCNSPTKDNGGAIQFGEYVRYRDAQNVEQDLKTNICLNITGEK